jgi:uncharacterized membrane protein YbhN (UPF0104 family)
MNWIQVGQVFGRLRLSLWLAAVVLYVLTQVLSAARWRLLAQPLGFQQSLLRYTAYYFLGMFFNLFLPTSVGGDVVRAFYLDDGTGQRLPAFVSVFVDRLSGLLVLLMLACAAVILCPIRLDAWIPASVWGALACALLGLAGLPLLVRWSQRFDRLRRLVAGVRFYHNRPRLLLTITGLSVIVQGANVVLVWLLGQAIAAPVPASYYWVAVPMVTLLTLAPVSLNGMGVREGGMVLFLTPLGVDEPTALSLAFLWFSVFTAASLCGAAVYLFGSFSRPEERQTNGSIRGDSDQGRAGQPSAAA